MGTKYRIIAFGNDHTNTIGIIQSLANRGYEIIALLYGEKTGIVKSSNYVSRIFSASDPDYCVRLLLECLSNKAYISLIIPCSDGAALALDHNRESLLCKGFLFSYSRKGISLDPFFQKDIQVRLAKEAGLNVPESVIIKEKKDLLTVTMFPCLIKPLVSSKGAKSHIRVCKSKEDLLKQYDSIANRSDTILQQYINRDYEISILGCGLMDGTCFIPVVEDKLSLYPKDVGLECLANIHALDDEEIIEGIKKLVTSIGYVGLFSVEMMHCKDDNRFYFTEINLRNDGAQSFIYKYGINLPLVHVNDLFRLQQVESDQLNPGYYIWDMHHLKSFMSRDISLRRWIREIKMSRGFLMYNKNDIRPFYRQYVYLLKKILKRKKTTHY